MPGTRFQLDDEQRERVRDCLAKTATSLIEPFEKFIGRIESSIDHFRAAELTVSSAAKPERTLREAHDALREVWLLSQEDDSSPGCCGAA